ncbi:exodeoxyribonuclease III [Nautilia sp. PV-1]|uniref:exodeoxyribonuclease III n=1 Tax=Nautilia sp. PV-1 TaxID=2579250 RepID=UPI000FD823D6|nr:exodeoxyribonuclease III [Nautilia sp. PV-1]AZV46504.1 exodeoxyribonuclease III [Nautilia sp. PV-1]
MKICTFNVNSIRSRLEIVQNLINEYGIDILCIQEIKVEEEKFPKIDNDFECVIHGQKKLNGVATCSRLPIEKYQKGFDGELEEARFLYTLIDDIHIINVYVPLGDNYGERFEYKMYFYEKLFEFLKKFDLNKDKVVLCGDMNVAFSDLDVWDPEIWEGEVTFLPEEKAMINTLLNMGFIDVIREFHKNERVYTFYDYRGAKVYKNEGMRLDYFLLSPAVAKEVSNVEILTQVRRKRKPTPSDHVPVIIEL